MSLGKTNIYITIIKTKIVTTKFRILWPLEMSRDCAITLLHENVTCYCIVGARIECAKIVVFCANTSQSNNNKILLNYQNFHNYKQ